MPEGSGQALNAPLIGSTSDDPFYAFRDELQLKVQECSTRFFRWKNLLETSDTARSREFKEEHGALRKEISGLQSGVSDLDQVLQRVQTHRSSFAHISDEELASRQSFIREMKNEIGSMKAAMTSPQTKGKVEADQKRELLRRKQQEPDVGAGGTGGHDNASFLEGQAQQQQMLHRQQDEHLEELEHGATRLGHMAVAIGDEIDHQNIMLDEMADDVEMTSGRMDAVLGRMDKMLKTSSRCQTWTILTLMAVLFLLMILVAWT